MERLLFEVVEELARHKVPAVFKGAVMLNHILRLNRIYSPQRGTIDIDLSWEADEDEGIIENRLNYILGNLELKGFSVECKRRYTRYILDITVKRHNDGTNMQCNRI